MGREAKSQTRAADTFSTMKLVAIVAACVTALLPAARSGAAAPLVRTFPSTTSILARGPLPPGGPALSLNAAIGELEDGVIAVSGATQIAVTVDRTGLGPLTLRLLFSHFVSFGSRLVPDALEPWDGGARQAEQANQPIWVQVEVPYGTSPGVYHASLAVVADGQATAVPLAVRVWPVALPQPGTPGGALLTSFQLSAQTYVNTAAKLYGFKSAQQYVAANVGLYAFLARYRISPASWGYGEPTSATGYVGDRRWWRDAAGNMAAEGANGFSAMRLPISSNRYSPRRYIAGLSPFAPETWCDYLGAVQGYWDRHNWTFPTVVPYLYALDEPNSTGFRLVGRQASAVHSCFPGAKDLVTGNPAPDNEYLWDGKGTDDVDIWVVLANRFYGTYTNPALVRRHVSYEWQHYSLIQRARARGKQIWTYVYASRGTPGLTASKPLSDARMLFLWAALEQLDGVLYGEGMTSYTGDPFTSVNRDGAFVLLYPGANSPVPSARLEQIRDGIEDWEVAHAAAERHGIAAVRSVLGRAGLFSASRAGVKLSCTTGCDRRSSTPFSWPAYSQDATTPGRIETARIELLRLASR
jgi:Domain of unknown function (DUF4091)